MPPLHLILGLSWFVLHSVVFLSPTTTSPRCHTTPLLWNPPQSAQMQHPYQTTGAEILRLLAVYQQTAARWIKSPPHSTFSLMNKSKRYLKNIQLSSQAYYHQLLSAKTGAVRPTVVHTLQFSRSLHLFHYYYFLILEKLERRTNKDFENGYCSLGLPNLVGAKIRTTCTFAYFRVETNFLQNFHH